MNRFSQVTTAIFALLLCATTYSAETVKAPVQSVGLFKNGLSVITRQIDIPADGEYKLEDVPVPLHGSWWVESDAEIETRVTKIKIQKPLKTITAGDYARALSGKKVEIYIRGEHTNLPTKLVGTVVEYKYEKPDVNWNRHYLQNRYYGMNPGQPRPAQGLLQIKHENGRIYLIEPTLIGMVNLSSSQKFEPQVTEEKNVLLFKAGNVSAGGSKIYVTYLSKGITWAPSYKVNLTDGEKLELTQKAVLKNELMDLADADIHLISGFPNVPFGHVTSLLSPTTTMANFFQQLNQRPGQQSNMMSQQMVMSNVAAPQAQPDLKPPQGEGVDIHYQNIGKRTMKEGDSLAFKTASAKADYERIVDWVIPDHRTANGRYIQEYERRNNPDKYDDAPWDALRFDNPLEFPMTTAAAIILDKGKFHGQSISYFTNPSEETTLRVTKALSVRTKAVETEQQGDRKIVYVGGNDYRKSTVNGELTATNYRKEKIKLHIKRRFSGELLKADKNPKTELMEEGVYSVNKRNQLIWELEIEPGATVTLKYSYEVLVDN